LTPTKNFKKEIRKAISFYVTQDVKDQYKENYKTLLQKTKRDLHKWKNIKCSWIGRWKNFSLTLYGKGRSPG